MGQSRGPQRAPDRSDQAEPAAAWEDLDARMGELVRSLSPEAADSEAEPLELAREVARGLARLRDAVAARDQGLAALRSQQDEFLSVVAHDLRTPLVAIQGFAQLLLSGGCLGERQTTYVERILQGVRAMSRLVEDLRTARRLDQGALALQRLTVDPAGFAADLVEMHREEARQKEVQIRLEAGPALPRLRCDPERLGQALSNLVQNAVKFSPRGGRVVLRLRPSPGHLRFEVQDQGPGLDEALLPRLFDRFIQGTTAGDPGGKGFGLGLHICREIVVLHGGRVGARNQPQGGSCFWAEVPLGGETARTEPADRAEDGTP